MEELGDEKWEEVKDLRRRKIKGREVEALRRGKIKWEKMKELGGDEKREVK